MGKRNRNRRRNKRRQRGKGTERWVVTMSGDVVDAGPYADATGAILGHWPMCSHVVQPVKIADPEGAFTVYAGGKMDMHLKDATGIDVQVPLCDVMGVYSPYAQGFRGKIWLTPAPDGGVWPMDVYKQTLYDIRDAAQAGKRVLVYCLGGHGRTGTMLAGLVGLFEKASDPIAAVRQRYCKEAIEGSRQSALVYSLIGRPLPKRYEREFGWWEYDKDTRWIAQKRGDTTVWTPATAMATTQPVHPESVAAVGISTVKTLYGSIQRWDDDLPPPPGRRVEAGGLAPSYAEVKAALDKRYEGHGGTEKLSQLVRRVLGATTLQVLPGYTKWLWWVYGDIVIEPRGARWECFLMYCGHESVPDGEITVEYGRTRIAPTMTGTAAPVQLPRKEGSCLS